MRETRAGVFRGAELQRMAFLLVVAVAGWVFVWNSARTPAVPVDPPQVATESPRPIEPDRSPAFETVQDKAALGFRDTAAYEKLLRLARESTPERLAAAARRDVFFTHLWGNPENHRGVPVHLLGTVRRVIRYESKLSRTGWLHEAWIFTREAQNHPYVCVFEDVPPGLPIGAEVSERVVFNGYFLKLMLYQAGDVPRAAPLLVGRIGWTPPPPGSRSTGWGSPTWLLAGLGLMFAFTLMRWMMSLRRGLMPRARTTAARERPSEEIAPDALADWVKTQAGRGEGGSDDVAG